MSGDILPMRRHLIGDKLEGGERDVKLCRSTARKLGTSHRSHDALREKRDLFSSAAFKLMNTAMFQIVDLDFQIGAHLGRQCNNLHTVSRSLVDHFYPHTPQTPGRAKWTSKPHPAFGKILGLLDWTMHWGTKLPCFLRG